MILHSNWIGIESFDVFYMGYNEAGLKKCVGSVDCVPYNLKRSRFRAMWQMYRVRDELSQRK